MVLRQKLAQLAGKHAERSACKQLQRAGLRLQQRNYQVRGGEIDLVMSDGDQLVFVEVRYRKRADHGTAAESVDRHKQRRLILAARHYLVNNTGEWAGCRFDVVAFDGGLGSGQMNWIKSAFLLEDGR